jgi:serine/threonine-protein kinase ULK/ATG1
LPTPLRSGDLGNYLRKKGRIPEPEARHWLQNLAAGLKYLREKNILHRDLKVLGAR